MSVCLLVHELKQAADAIEGEGTEIFKDFEADNFLLDPAKARSDESAEINQHPSSNYSVSSLFISRVRMLVNCIYSVCCSLFTKTKFRVIEQREYKVGSV